MKSGLTVVLFRLFTIGVFVGGKESNGELVSVMEGDSVTLMSGVTKMKTNDKITWEFNGSPLATISIDSGKLSEWIKPDGPFRNRLQLDKQTGDLKISNIKTTDSGPYKPMISSPDGSPPEMTFTVSVVFADEDKSVTVMEGDPVTLQPDPTYIQGSDVIWWRFGLQKSLVAEINRRDGIFNPYDGPDERFRDRLQLGSQTGSLTITNINITDAGLYEAEISSTRRRYTTHHTQSFSVTVSDEVKSVSVLEGDSVTLRTGLTEIQRDDEILWKFGDHGEFIARLNGPVNKKWSNIHLNNQTGDLNISNIKSVQYGYYKVEIKTRRMVLHMKYHIYRTAVIVSVMVGDSVTLHTGFKIQNTHAVSWFKDQHHITSSTDINEGTGDLTIRNIQRDKSGDYKVYIISSSSSSTTPVFHRKFHINITGVFSSEKDGVKKVSVVNGNNFTLHNNDTDIQNYVLIEWMFGSQNLSIAKADGKSKNTIYNDVIFKNKVYLDNQTGDLSIQNPGTEHTGSYLLKIIYSRYTIQKNFSVTVSVSDSGLSPGKTPVVVVCVLLVVAAAAVAGVIYIWKKQQKIIENVSDGDPPPNPVLLSGNGNGNENETELNNTSLNVNSGSL